MPKDTYHAKSIEATLAAFGTSVRGLATATAAERLETYGPNELPTDAPASALLRFLKQFNSALVYILFAAAGVSFATGHPFDAVAIVLVVFLNAIIGFVQERKAEEALSRLRDMVVPTASVRRDGNVMRVRASEIVPGDVVLVAQGDRVSADLRLFAARDLEADESALTGESQAVAKRVEPVAAEAGLGDRYSMLHMGTLVTSGEGAGVAVATGIDTAFGEVAKSLVAIRRAPTPLELRIDRLGKALAAAAILSSAGIMLAGILRGVPVLEMLLTAVAAAVSAIPEGLPVVLAVTLAIGVQRMAARNAITRHLPAVETLGVVDIICTDKTGTLTENKMTVRELFTIDREAQVTGEGWKPEGDFRSAGAPISLADRPVLHHLVRVAAASTNAGLELRDGRWTAIGDPTEASLVVLGAKAGFDPGTLRDEPALDEVPFSSERMYRAVLREWSAPNGGRRREIMVAGALEVLLERCRTVLAEDAPRLLDEAAVVQIKAANDRLAGRSMRVLAVASRQVDSAVHEVDEEDIRDLTFLGLVGMIDPPRKGVAEAVRLCQAAGIRIIMNTGDHKATAVAIAREIGILPVEGGVEDRVFSDAQASAMSDDELRAKLSDAAVFARVSPQTKLRVVTLLRGQGHIVAMTGDGINDAPALKRADIGIAMGIAGTDVTKEVADMVLSDDNFISIVSAVEEGRIIFRNVKQTTAYLIITNAAELVTMIAALLLGMPLLLLPAQILWLNLVTDGFNCVALATEGPHGDELGRPPRRKGEPIVSKSALALTAIVALLMAVGTILLFAWANGREGLAYARSVAFLSMSFFQLWNVFNMRSETDSIFRLGWGSNRWVLWGIAGSILCAYVIMGVPTLAKLFGLAAVGFDGWALALIVSASVIPAVEGWKWLIRKGIVPRSWV